MMVNTTDDLLETLRAQHRSLQAQMEEVDSALRLGDVPGLVRALRLLSSTMRAHHELEDRILYPELILAAYSKKAHDVAAMSEGLAISMRSVTQTLSQFAEQHLSGAMDLSLFHAEWPGVRSLLEARLATEETGVYPDYERLLGPS
jgi:hypothetical protein